MKLVKIEPRIEGSEEMVLVVPPKMVEKLENVKFYPECCGSDLTFQFVTRGIPIDTTESDDVSEEEIKKRIQDNVNRYVETRAECGEFFKDLYPDHPFPFHDFPAPINEHIAKNEIREHNQMMEDFENDLDDDCGYVNDVPIDELEAASKEDAIMYSKSFEEAVLTEPSLISMGEIDFEKEKATIHQLAAQCNIPDWKVIFYLKVYDKLEYASEC